MKYQQNDDCVTKIVKQLSWIEKRKLFSLHLFLKQLNWIPYWFLQISSSSND
jgi:hypothetical protein